MESWLKIEPFVLRLPDLKLIIKIMNILLRSRVLSTKFRWAPDRQIINRSDKSGYFLNPV